MYVGRIVVVGRNGDRIWVAYRVSSRSFPRRKAVIWGQSVRISPSDDKDLANNPYIFYNCIRVWGDFAIVANGNQSDILLEKIQDGQRPIDAIVLTLLAQGFERDEFDTPRLAGVVVGNNAWLGIVGKHEFHVKQFDLKNGSAFMVATYGKTDFEPVCLSAESAAELANCVFKLDFDNPICATAAMSFPNGQGFELAVHNPT